PHSDVRPLPLPELEYAQQAAREVTEQDREPDLPRPERAGPVEHEAEPDGQHDLRDDGDVERAARIAGTLQSARVRERDGDEDAGQAQESEQLRAELDDHGVAHAEDREEPTRQQQEQHTEEDRDADREARG